MARGVMMRKNRFVIVFLSFMLILAFSVPTFAASAKQKLQNVREEKTMLSLNIDKLEKSIKSQQQKLDRISADIAVSKGKLDKLNRDLAEKEDDINKRKSGMSNRLRAMYKNGSIGYLDVILGSNSVTDLVTNVELVQNIYKGDQQTLVSLRTDKKELESRQAAVRKQKRIMDGQKTEMLSNKIKLQTSMAQYKAKYSEVRKEEKALQRRIAAIASKGTYTGRSSGRFVHPLPGAPVTSPFGWRIHPIYRTKKFHDGVDFGGRRGQPIHAADSGKVISASPNCGYGNCVVIDHGGGLQTWYAHCSAFRVSTGQRVRRGQVIALVGSTGWSTGPHLHFKVMNGGRDVNPLSFL